MKKKTWLHSFFMLLIAGLLVFAAACSNKANQQSGPSGQASQSAASTAGATSSSVPAKEEDGPLTKYKDPVQATIYAITDPTHKYIAGEDPDNNFWTKLQKDKLNIEFKNMFTVEQAKAGEKINLAIASNQIPDFTMVDSASLSRMIKNGQVQALNDVYEKYGTPVLKERLGFQNNIAFKPATAGGNIYGLPVPNDFANNIAMMYIRTDWLKKLHLQVPKTLDELTAVAKAFTENDPDGNNKKDTYGIGAYKGLTNLLDAVAAANKAYPNFWVKDNSGKLVSGTIQPEMKNTLKLLQQWYKDGIIDPEFAVKEQQQALADVTAGKVGIWFGVFWHPFLLEPTLTNAKGSDWGVYPIPAGADGTVTPMAYPFATQWITVKKDYPHPEALVKSLNLLWDPEIEKLIVDVKQDKYKDVATMMHGYMRPYLIDIPNKNLTTSDKVLKVMDTKDESILATPEEKDVWKSISNNDWKFKKIYLEAEPNLHTYQTLKYSEFMGAPTPTIISRGASLDKLQEETITKIIMGNSVADFDKFVEQWKKLGGDEITKEVNDWASGQ